MMQAIGNLGRYLMVMWSEQQLVMKLDTNMKLHGDVVGVHVHSW
jgi:hypothetical protein